MMVWGALTASGYNRSTDEPASYLPTECEVIGDTLSCSRKTTEAGVGVVASTDGCGTKMVAGAMIKAASSELADHSERGFGLGRAAVLDQDL
jgi:hypothetical protein